MDGSIHHIASPSDKKKRKREAHWLSPHAGQVFCPCGTLAPHSTQYFAAAVEAALPLVAVVAVAVAMPTEEDVVVEEEEEPSIDMACKV